MNVLGIDDELAEEYAPIPPDFTKGYPLPDGWKWQCYDDGRGYSLASIEREVRHVPEQSHDGGPCPPGGPER